MRCLFGGKDMCRKDYIAVPTGSSPSARGKFIRIQDLYGFLKKGKDHTAAGEIQTLTAHHTETVGSRSATATINSPEIVIFQDYLFVLRSKRFSSVFERSYQTLTVTHITMGLINKPSPISLSVTDICESL